MRGFVNQVAALRKPKVGCTISISKNWHVCCQCKQEATPTSPLIGYVATVDMGKRLPKPVDAYFSLILPV